MTDDNKIIWNASVKQMIADGYPIISAFEISTYALKEAETPTPVSVLISGSSQKLKPETVEVRYDDLKLVIEGWEKYKASNAELELGKAMGLEGIGRGIHKAVRVAKTNYRNVTLAVHVTQLMEEGHSKTKAIEAIAKENGMSVDAVRKAIGPPDQKKLKQAIAKR